MIKRNLLNFALLFCLAFCGGPAKAQKFAGKAGKDYSAQPYWIAMMKDTNTNYFEAVKAFNGYWKGREKPQGENEKFENAGKNNAESKNIPYSFEYKKFQLWQMQVKPYVQNDGSILYPYLRHRLRQEARRATPSKQ